MSSGRRDERSGRYRFDNLRNAGSANSPQDVELARVSIRLSFVLRQDLGTSLASLSSVPREVMRIVVRHPGLSVSQIAQITGRQLSNTSLSISVLVEHGLARRDVDPAESVNPSWPHVAA